jgi:hypothetical protein
MPPPPFQVRYGLLPPDLFCFPPLLCTFRVPANIKHGTCVMITGSRFLLPHPVWSMAGIEEWDLDVDAFLDDVSPACIARHRDCSWSLQSLHRTHTL